MLATRVRVRPCSALWRLSSEGRRTTTAFSSSASVRSGCVARLISPFGPFTVIRLPSIWAVTPLGSGTGFLPMRDMSLLLPDHREQLAAHAGGAGFAVGHEALWRGQDRHAEAVLDARDLARLHGAAQARNGPALQPSDHPRVPVIHWIQPQQPLHFLVQYP